MTLEEQCIAIAQACGFKRRLSGDMVKVYVWDTPNGSIPDYLNDLNAMSRAEEIGLNGKWCIPPTGEVRLYEEILVEIAVRDDNIMFHATAAQRAEAFLRAKGLWKS